MDMLLQFTWCSTLRDLRKRQARKLSEDKDDQVAGKLEYDIFFPPKYNISDQALHDGFTFLF